MVFLIDEFKWKCAVLITTNEFRFEVGFPGAEMMFCVYNFIIPTNSVFGIPPLSIPPVPRNSFYGIPHFCNIPPQHGSVPPQNLLHAYCCGCAPVPFLLRTNVCFWKNYPVFGFVFSVEKSERLGGLEVSRKVDGLGVDILTLVTDKILVISKGT